MQEIFIEMSERLHNVLRDFLFGCGLLLPILGIFCEKSYKFTLIYCDKNTIFAPMFAHPTAKRVMQSKFDKILCEAAPVFGSDFSPHELSDPILLGRTSFRSFTKR
jgi:hypothetical protein